MDVNGARFHLIHGNEDWDQCVVDDAQPDSGAVWDAEREMFTLQPKQALFLPRGRRKVPLQPSARRGAAFDQFGNAFWIGRDRRTIFWSPLGSNQTHVYWRHNDPDGPGNTGGFRPAYRQPRKIELAGLAINQRLYLVVGNTTQNGVFVFDLHAGGEPLLLLFPRSFTPFDMSAASNGDVWILDREHRTYWGLDSNFRLIVKLNPHSLQNHDRREVQPHGWAPRLRSQALEDTPASTIGQCAEGFKTDAHDPISIVALNDHGVLILDNPQASATSGSALRHCRLGKQLSPPLLLPSLDRLAEGERERPVNGHDMAYVASNDYLYVVERDGNQSIAYTLGEPNTETPLTSAVVKTDYLPMHAFGSRALIVRHDEVVYDVGSGTPTDGGEPLGDDRAIRWVGLRNIDQPRYRREASVSLPVWDGRQRDCVWHRLFIDACIPSETSVRVWARAADDEDVLQSLPFLPEPTLYLRGAGSELPYHQPFVGSEQSREGTGTWELLFQHARGRYLQIKLALRGNGRATPRLRSLRAYYPRFSYPERYLPAVYRDHAESADFLERLLANPEGLLSDIEGKIAEVSLLFDARTVPPDALDWLANWLGLMFDPLWSQLPRSRLPRRRQRAGIGNQHSHDPDRRRLFLRLARELYERRGTSDGIRFALHLLLDPCLEQLLDRFRAATVREDVALRTELDAVDLPYPAQASSDVELETLLCRFLISPCRSSNVRLVERFETRRARALVAGDATPADADLSLEKSAHRFSVLVPEGLSQEEEAMVKRLVDLEKPAHTQFDMRRYWDYFLVGEARLGLDTQMGEEHRLQHTVLGRDYLAEGFLSAAHPMDVAERWVTDRDRLGDRPL